MTEFQLAFSTVESEDNYFTGSPEQFDNRRGLQPLAPGVYRLNAEGALEPVTPAGSILDPSAA